MLVSSRACTLKERRGDSARRVLNKSEIVTLKEGEILDGVECKAHFVSSRGRDTGDVSDRYDAPGERMATFRLLVGRVVTKERTEVFCLGVLVRSRVPLQLKLVTFD